MYCSICKNKNLTINFSNKSNKMRHMKKFHSTELEHEHEPEIELEHEHEPILDKKTIIDHIQSLSHKIDNIIPAKQTVSIAPSTINNTIYFNKDLKYYPELVKIMGREKACNYLLYGMPETKDIFGVIDKLFLQNGALNCPFRYDQDTGDFLIARAEGVFDRDPTGETIDRENKSKLQDAILSAYVDTTKQISRECADLRIARLNGEYTEADQEKLTRRFDALMTVEPIRPYEVIDLMNGLKPKKRDYDKIKKMCPAIVKKITIS